LASTWQPTGKCRLEADDASGPASYRRVAGEELTGEDTMGQLATGLLSLSGWAALALVFMLPALEAPAFLGLVLPGELTLLLGGVLAHQDRIPLVAALAVGVAGALAGDSAGYWIGRHWGPRLLTSGLGRRVGPARLHTVEGLLLRGGGWALVVGRCTAGARVVLPGLAGMLGLRYRTFAAWTGVAATLWAAAHVLLGYAAGAGWRHLHQLTGRIGLALAGAVLVALAVAWLLRRPARGHQAEPASPSPQGGAAPRPAETKKRPRRSPPSTTDHKRFREAVAVDREEQPC
jgi:membrane protein DedA with SNARE-associated domain